MYGIRVLHISMWSSLSVSTDVYNKIDSISLEQMDKLARQPHTVVISCELDLKYVHFILVYLCMCVLT